MNHVLAKILLIDNVVELISKNSHLSLDEARKKLYESQLIDLIDDDETGLYGESPLYVYSLFEKEIAKNKD